MPYPCAWPLTLALSPLVRGEGTTAQSNGPHLSWKIAFGRIELPLPASGERAGVRGQARRSSMGRPA
ncbi:hypothetical protein GGD50_002431 [Rhizobium paranaense]|uniref:Uncharacterized protein n=1 Tax=Rhizobium paranaense TaxID=1650438 RepID=A0A7W8XQN1_9HYPH|nr:hypothetical protein [Rhizobium paranaense]